MKVEIRAALDEDIDPIAASPRPADVAELWASSRTTPRAALVDGLRASDMAWTGLVDGVPVCMFGTVPASILLGIGVPWMIGSTGLCPIRVQKELLKRSRPALNAMKARYDSLCNVVDDRNASAIRWLRWLGFKIAEETMPHGPDKMPFRVFSLGREVGDV